MLPPTPNSPHGVAGAGGSQYKPPDGGDHWDRGDRPPRTLNRAPDAQNAHLKYCQQRASATECLDPAPDNRDSPKRHPQSRLNPAPENRGLKAMVQHVPVLDAAPEPVNREWQYRNAPPAQPIPRVVYGAVPPPHHVRQSSQHIVIYIIFIPHFYTGPCDYST